MTTSTDPAPFPSLFSHSKRKDWGVGILSWENEGKRRYLFENGEERTLASGFHELMHKVEAPSAEQQAAYARLRGVLAARAPVGGQVKGWSFSEQLVQFHDRFPSGMSDPKWVTEIRGEGVEKRAPRFRQAAIREAGELLSAKVLDAMLTNQQFSQLWEHALNVVKNTDLVPIAQFKQRSPGADQQRTLSLATRELLHGSATYEQRFDRFVTAFAGAFGEYPRWEMATVLSGLVHPGEHVCVEPTAFRKQLKLASRRSVAAQPSSAGYTSFLGVARFIANQLAEQGELPRDLLDTRDFIVTTLKTKARPPRAKPKAAKAAKKTEEAPPADDE